MHIGPHVFRWTINCATYTSTYWFCNIMWSYVAAANSICNERGLCAGCMYLVENSDLFSNSSTLWWTRDSWVSRGVMLETLSCSDSTCKLLGKVHAMKHWNKVQVGFSAGCLTLNPELSERRGHFWAFEWLCEGESIQMEGAKKLTMGLIVFLVRFSCQWRWSHSNMMRWLLTRNFWSQEWTNCSLCCCITIHSRLHVILIWEVPIIYGKKESIEEYNLETLDYYGIYFSQFLEVQYVLIYYKKIMNYYILVPCWYHKIISNNIALR